MSRLGSPILPLLLVSFALTAALEGCKGPHVGVIATEDGGASGTPSGVSGGAGATGDGGRSSTPSGGQSGVETAGGSDAGRPVGGGAGGTTTGGTSGTCETMFDEAPQLIHDSSEYGPWDAQASETSFFFTQGSGSKYLHRIRDDAQEAVRYETFPVQSGAGGWDVKANDQLIAHWRILTSLTVYGAGDASELGNLSEPDIRAVAVHGSTAYYLQNDAESSVVHSYEPPLIGNIGSVPLPTAYWLATTGSAFYVADQAEVRAVGVDQPLLTVADVTWLEARSDGVLVTSGDQQQDATQYFAPLAGEPTVELAQALAALPAAEGCEPSAHHYRGPGTLFGSHYVYQAEGGTFMVELAPTGVSEPRRVSTHTFQYLRVTESGTLYGASFQDGTLVFRFPVAGLKP